MGSINLLWALANTISFFSFLPYSYLFQRIAERSESLFLIFWELLETKIVYACISYLWLCNKLSQFSRLTKQTLLVTQGFWGVVFGSGSLEVQLRSSRVVVIRGLDWGWRVCFRDGWWQHSGFPHHRGSLQETWMSSHVCWVPQSRQSKRVQAREWKAEVPFVI